MNPDTCAGCGAALNGTPSAHNGKNGPAYCETCFREEIEADRGEALAEAMRYRWPTFHAGGHAEVEAVAALRRLPLAGVALARARGLLRFGTLHGAPVWIVTDDARQLAQARRMDGKPWREGAKGLTLRGSRGGWPLGVEAVPTMPKGALILWVEGGPDLLAGCCVAAASGRPEAVGVVAMLGASMKPSEETLSAFKARRVRICQHRDDAGARAARSWGAALFGAGGEADVWGPEPGSPHDDLADAIVGGVPPSEILRGVFP